MLFSSPLFLYLFLPITLLGYYLAIKKMKNYWLLLMSLIFFAWGGVSYTIILIGSIVLNYFFGLAIDRSGKEQKARAWLTAGITCNILLLGIFKYTNFLISNINHLFLSISLPKITSPDILLPVGISFYTFHALSYLIDIYRKKTTAQKNIFDLALYIAMFSQLIAGPIVRYSDIWLQLKNRTHTLARFSSGIERFIIGLAKKVLLANTLANVADYIFDTGDLANLGYANAWLGMISYTFQIYCDFSGYSDMAIGLGRMFGFEFMENFNFPYLARSVKEFWRRWHISLSTFFRDYVYIPLGGNKVKTSRMYLNLLIVFFLTGFWHGANWTFVVWGLLHGFFMIIERLGFEKFLTRIWPPIANIYTLLVVMLAWVLFRAKTFGAAIQFWEALFDFKNDHGHVVRFMNFANIQFCIALAVAVLGSFGFFRYIGSLLNKIFQAKNAVSTGLTYVYHVVSVFIYAGLLILSSMYLIAGTYNPFIYYQF
jgi:alginate O-acetyltransferase complex protein AlgI